MNKLQQNSDKTAMGLSFLCALHCLALPFAIILVPSLAALPLADEAFHVWMVFVVLPVSIYALTIGIKGHKHYRVLLIGGAGLAILTVAAFWGHDLFGHGVEKAMTLLGAALIAYSHYWTIALAKLK